MSTKSWNTKYIRLATKHCLGYGLGHDSVIIEIFSFFLTIFFYFYKKFFIYFYFIIYNFLDFGFY